MKNIELYRRRFVPDEIVHLKDDEIIRADDDIIITKWNVIRPRKDFTHGVSCYFIKEGYKVSKFIDKNNNILYWYCDITDVMKEGNKYIFNDLLIDVIVYEDGTVKVADLGETGKALEDNIITKDIAVKAMVRADKLLNIIYSNRFDELKAYIEEV